MSERESDRRGRREDHSAGRGGGGGGGGGRDEVTLDALKTTKEDKMYGSV